MVERAMPPQVMLQLVGAFPMAYEPLQPQDAVALAPLHLHDVRDRVRRPQVGGIDLDGFAAGCLRGGIIAALLERERAAAEERPVAGQLAAPFRRDALDGSEHLARASG